MAPAVHRRRTMTRPHAGHPRRDPPRRRLPILGRRRQGGLRAGRTPADAHRHAVPLRREPDPVRRRTSAGATGCCGPGPTRRTATPTRCADGVVRPVIFLAYSGETRWRTSAGEELAARLGEPMTQDVIAQAWRTALDPAGDWMPQVLRAADARLQVLRAGGMPDAGGLVIATDQKTARAYAQAARRDHRREGGRGALRRRRRLRRASPRSPRSDAALDGRGADGLRGRRHPAPGRRRLRHQRLHAAVLRPGDRPVRPGAPAGRDRDASSCPACRTCSGWPARWRPSATTCSARRTTGRLRRRPARAGAADRGGQRRAGRSGSRRCRPPPSSTR